VSIWLADSVKISRIASDGIPERLILDCHIQEVVFKKVVSFGFE
jgi:hypothetical protein